MSDGICCSLWGSQVSRLGAWDRGCAPGVMHQGYANNAGLRTGIMPQGYDPGLRPQGCTLGYRNVALSALEVSPIIPGLRTGIMPQGCTLGYRMSRFQRLGFDPGDVGCVAGAPVFEISSGSTTVSPGYMWKYVRGPRLWAGRLIRGRCRCMPATAFAAFYK